MLPGTVETGGDAVTMADVLETTLLALQAAAGCPVSFSRTVATSAPGEGFLITAWVQSPAEGNVSYELTRGDKVIAFKKRRRQNSKRSRGHRQHQTTVRILDIVGAGKSAASEAK